MRATRFFDGVGWRTGTIDLVDGRPRLSDDLPSAELVPLDGVVVGGFTDHHVHLQLVAHALLHQSALGRVVDLGANPGVIAALAAGARLAPRHNSGNPSVPLPDSDASDPPHTESPELWSHQTPHPVTVEFAGAFLTPVGGYPSDRSWAPAGAVREITDAAGAVIAVDEMAAAGASSIKVADNSTAGPVFDDELFGTIIGAALSRGLDVTVHAEGPGAANRAARLGATHLAHAPFTERLDDDAIAEHTASVAWVSTLAIHTDVARETAIDNVRRFHAAGGTVLYGTDMGNGPTPVGVNPAEIAALRAAGLDTATILRALAPQNPLDPTSLLLLLPSPDADPGSARPLLPSDLKV